MPHQGVSRAHHEVLEQRIHEPCQQRQFDAEMEPPPSPPKAVGKKVTRAQIIAELFKLQARRPPSLNERAFAQTPGYLKRSKCGISAHKRANDEAFNGFVNSACIDQSYDQPHKARHSHQVWRTGNRRIHCKSCGVQAHLDASDNLVLSANLRKTCKGAAIRGSPDIKELFQATSHKQGPQLSSALEKGNPPPTTEDILSPMQPQSRRGTATRSCLIITGHDTQPKP